MNETITHYIMYFATFIYFSYMIKYIIDNVFRQQTSMLGLVFILDILRYTSMFLSFILTMYFGVEAGNSMINSKPLEPLETILAYGFTIVISAFVSAIISSLLVHAERAISEGGLSTLQFYTVVMIYLLVATIDFITLSVGGGRIAKTFAEEDIARVETKQDSQNTFIINSKREIALDLQEQLRGIKRQIQNISSTQPILTKRVRTLNATLARCAKKHKPCPDTHAEFERIRKSQQTKKLERLNEKRATVLSKLSDITSSFESTSTRLSTAKSNVIKEIEEKSRDLQWWITFGSILFVLSNLFMSIVRTILANTLEVEVEEEEEVEPVQTPKGLSYAKKKEYVEGAIRVIAEQKQTKISSADIHSSDFKWGTGYSRDDVKAVVLRLAEANKVDFSWGNSDLIFTIREYMKVNGKFRQWLLREAWNEPLDEQKIRYHTA